VQPVTTNSTQNIPPTIPTNISQVAVDVPIIDLTNWTISQLP